MDSTPPRTRPAAPDALSAPSAPTLIFKLASIVGRLDFAALFPVCQPVEVELGSGDGSFLAEYAVLHPERNFLGVERLLGRLRKLDRKGLRRGARNLRLVRLEAAYLVGYLLPPASIAALHIYFPDPWPKRKHRKNRLVNPEFLRAVHQALAPEGKVYLRTDDEDYFTQMRFVFGDSPDFREIDTPEELKMVVTDFERNFLTRQIQTRRAAFAKCG